MLVLFIPSAGSYEPIGGVFRDYVRVLALLGKSDWEPRQMYSYSNSRSILETIRTENHLWHNRLPGSLSTVTGLMPLDADLRFSGNTEVPHNRNNDSQWEGRGLNGLLRGGVAFQYHGLSAIFAPEIWFAQNLAFETMESSTWSESEYGDYFSGIDRPQRFGDAPVFEVWAGQSTLQYKRWNTVIGVTSENMWLGPTSDNAIVMSNNAAGFPRLEIGTAEPASTKLGRFEAATWWGALEESDFFDSDSANDYRFIMGYTLGFGPPVFNSLHLGFNRMYVSPMETVDAFKVFQHFDSFFKRNRPDFVDDGEDDITQVASVTAHWFLPSSGFETYLEWARNDHTANPTDFIYNPEHSQAFILGFRKVYDLERFYLSVGAELAKLGNNETTTKGSPRPTFPYYRHGPVEQGYTNRGQELGAWIGTGSNSQHMYADAYFDWGKLNIGFTRHVFDNDYFLERRDPSLWPSTPYRGYNVRLISEIGILYFLDRMIFEIDYAFHRLRKWNWETGEPKYNNTITMALRVPFR